jgi:hypothetical protein
VKDLRIFAQALPIAIFAGRFSLIRFARFALCFACLIVKDYHLSQLFGGVIPAVIFAALCGLLVFVLNCFMPLLLRVDALVNLQN